MKRNEILKLTSSDMSVVSLESPGAAATCGHGLTGVPGDCATGLIGVLGTEELLEATGVCKIKIQNIVG